MLYLLNTILLYYMKWKDFRSYINLFFDDNDEIIITVDNDVPVIKLVTKNNDSEYSVIISSLDSENFVWNWSEIASTNFKDNN